MSVNFKIDRSEPCQIPEPMVIPPNENPFPESAELGASLVRQREIQAEIDRREAERLAREGPIRGAD